MEEDYITAGGGVFIKGEAVSTLRNCEITYNTAHYGAGIYITDSSPIISDCRISHNTPIKSDSEGCGGGISIWNNSNPIITGCEIFKNKGLYGGALFSELSSPIISGCIIKNNAAEKWEQFGGYQLF